MDNDQWKELYNRALQLDPDNSDIWQGMGEALYYQRKFQEAAACFAEGARRAKDASQLLYNLALCDLELGRVAAARETLSKLVKEDPEYRLAQDLLRSLDAASSK